MPESKGVLIMTVDPDFIRGGVWRVEPSAWSYCTVCLESEVERGSRETMGEAIQAASLSVRFWRSLASAGELELAVIT